jgi:hypothetical protein
MRKLFLAAVGALVVAGAASAQQPNYTLQPNPAPPYPAQAAPGAQAVQPAGLRGPGCTNCGPAAGPGVGAKFMMAAGGDCQYGRGCQNGCGSLKSDLAFHFGSCKGFFAPCGPTCGSGGLFGLRGHCPQLPLNPPYGTGWCCPRQYDSYANH